MTTFTTEDQINVYDIEDREDRERMLRDQNRILAEEIQTLKMKLTQAEKRAEGWKDAYHNAMDSMAKMCKSKA